MTGDNIEQREVREYCFFHDLNHYNRQTVAQLNLSPRFGLFLQKRYTFFSLICSHNRRC